ncbi:hypothetical protein [Klebsiella quasipneumoniae]|uniref:hypothetical protein n=1 Tax=Klebsiella quasipneumoniae TaxID=1463165 RepID=UPI00103422BF|nr:hypothetical protein [Klebsiella quasipneumoniae]
MPERLTVNICCKAKWWLSAYLWLWIKKEQIKACITQQEITAEEINAMDDWMTKKGFVLKVG